MKLKSFILLMTSSLAVFSLPALAESEAKSQFISPYIMLGCTLDSSAGFPQYITTSVTYGYNAGNLHPYNHISCGQNLEYAQSKYDVVNVTAVGNEIVYTLKYRQ